MPDPLQGLSTTTESTPTGCDARGFAMLDAYLISIASLTSTMGMAAVFLWVYRR